MKRVCSFSEQFHRFFFLYSFICLAHSNDFSFPSYKKQKEEIPTAVMHTSTLEMSKAPLRVSITKHGVCMRTCTFPLISEFSNDFRVQFRDLKATVRNSISITCRRNADRRVHAGESGFHLHATGVSKVKKKKKKPAFLQKYRLEKCYIGM